MVLEVKKQPTESSQSLLRRFTKGIQRSGVLFKVRKNQFMKRPKSDQAKKKAALRKEELKVEYEKLKKLGKLPIKEKRR